MTHAKAIKGGDLLLQERWDYFWFYKSKQYAFSLRTPDPRLLRKLLWHRLNGLMHQEEARGLLHGLVYMARHIPGPFGRPTLHYQEGVVVLFQDGPELDGGEGPPHYHGAASSKLSRLKRMPVIKRILNCCGWGLPFRPGPASPPGR